MERADCDGKDRHESGNENLATAIYDFDADILGLKPKSYFPEQYNRFISFKEGDQIHIIDKIHSDFWLGKLITSDAVGIVPSFLMKLPGEDNHSAVKDFDEGYNTIWERKNYQTIRAIQEFDAQTLRGYLSYEKEEQFKIIKTLDRSGGGSRMLLVKSEKTKMVGLIRRANTYLFNASALYDFDAKLLQVDSVYGLNSQFRKGDSFYVIQSFSDLDSWRVQQHSQSSHHIYPMQYFEVHTNSIPPFVGINVEAKNETVIFMEDLNATSLRGHLSYSEGDTVQYIRVFKNAAAFAKSLTTGEEGFIYATNAARYETEALYDFDTKTLGLEDIVRADIRFKKGDILYIKSGKLDIDRLWEVRVKATKQEGNIPTFFLTKSNVGVENSLDFEYLNSNRNISVALKEFEAKDLRQFLSYEQGEKLEIIEFSDSRFWKAKKILSRMTGIVDRYNLAIAEGVVFFDFDSRQFIDGFKNASKGEMLYLVSKINAELWYAVSKVDGGSGLISGYLLGVIPIDTNLTKSYSQEIMNTVKTIKEFHEENFENFLTFDRDENLQILRKLNNQTWFVKSIVRNKTGLVPTFLLEKVELNPKKTFSALKNFEQNIYLIQQQEHFLNYAKRDILNVTKTHHPKIWFATSEDGSDEGFILRTDVIDQCQGYTCGDVCVPYSEAYQEGFKCACGDTNLRNIVNYYCCISPKDYCVKISNLLVYCPKGMVKPISKPCYKSCYRDYRASENALHYTCNGYAGCISTSSMCQGADWCGELQQCNEDLRCKDEFIDHETEISYFNRLFKTGEVGTLNPKSVIQPKGKIATKLITQHNFCKNGNLIGDKKYDWLDRQDEVIENSLKQVSKINYSFLHDCIDFFGNKGKSCYYNYSDFKKKKYSCKTTWCQNSYIDQTKCIVGEDRSENSDNYKTLCSNHTFWKSSDCDTKTFKGNYFLVLF